MEDGKPTFYSEYRNLIYEKYERNFLQKIFWYRDDYQSNYIEAKLGNTKDSAAYIYFIKRPYCSSLETTYKPSLLLPKRYMKQWNRHGTLTATFDINFFDPNNPNISFSVLEFRDFVETRKQIDFTNGDVWSVIWVSRF